MEPDEGGGGAGGVGGRQGRCGGLSCLSWVGFGLRDVDPFFVQECKFGSFKRSLCDGRIFLVLSIQ